MFATAHLANWSGPRIDAECAVKHRAYRARRTSSYQTYFAAHVEIKDEHHAYKAKDLATALPDGWGKLTAALPVSERHKEHLSGNSSQVLALGLLGVAAQRDPSLVWLWEGLGPLPPPAAPHPGYQFERKLEPKTLKEQPRQTSIDFFVDDPAALLCIEAKWTEAGMGACGCGTKAAAKSECGEKVLSRTAYWTTARDVLHLPERAVGTPCPLSFTYQAVRNVAAAVKLAKPGQQPVFGLIYDAQNPYFAGCGAWPGWPAALNATLNDVGAAVRFASVSWQELVPLLPLDEAAAAWALEKHGLD
jgi:hypothetical protein